MSGPAGAADLVHAGVQMALAIIEARRFQQPGSYREAIQVSTGELDRLIADLREHDAHSNYPIRTYRGKFDGDDWMLCFGEAADDPRPVIVTTDRVHCSELRGDAADDAACFVAVRNHLPVIIAALEELLEARLRGNGA